MRVILALAATLALFGAQASAQTEQRWTSSSGLWSLDYVSAGWTFADPVPPELAHFTRIVIPLVPPPDNEVRFCTVSEIAEPRQSESDEDIRAGATRVDQAAAARLFPRDTITGVSISTVSGVSVADVHATRGEMVLRHRLFALPLEGQLLSVQIDCAWPAALDAAKAAEASAVLETLAIGDAP